MRFQLKMFETQKDFQIAEENYQKALQRLGERYDKKYLIVFDSIDQIFDIPKTSKPNASMSCKAVDTVLAIYDSLLSIENDEDITSTLLIHIMLSKVN